MDTDQAAKNVIKSSVKAAGKAAIKFVKFLLHLIPLPVKLIAFGLLFALLCAYAIFYGDSEEEHTTEDTIEYMEDGYEATEDGIPTVALNGFVIGDPAYNGELVSDGTMVFPADMSYMRVTSEFGYRNQPKAGASTNHQGVDLAVPNGSNLYAAISGTVHVTNSKGGGKGIYIDTEINGVPFQVRYWHLSSQDVSEGQRIEVGDYIGKSGNTGISTGPHLHFETRVDGVAVNPRNYYDFGPIK